jgi:hypothetical protein
VIVHHLKELSSCSFQSFLRLRTLIGMISGSTSSLCNTAKKVVLLLGPFFVFALEETADMAEKKKATPSMASITSFSCRRLEAICNVASSMSSRGTRHVARHATARCLGFS